MSKFVRNTIINKDSSDHSTTILYHLIHQLLWHDAPDQNNVLSGDWDECDKYQAVFYLYLFYFSKFIGGHFNFNFFAI